MYGRSTSQLRNLQSPTEDSRGDFVVIPRDPSALRAASAALDSKGSEVAQHPQTQSSHSGDSSSHEHKSLWAPKIGLLRGMSRNSDKASLPPEIFSFPPYRMSVRYYVSSAVSDAALTFADLRNSLLVVGRVSNTSFTPVFSSVKLRKITIWNAPNLGSCELAWLASDISRVPDLVANTATPSGSVTTRKQVFAPAKGSIAQDWMLSTLTGTTQVFRISIPQGSIMDIDVEVTLPTGHITESAVNSVSGSVTVGAFYRLYLDRSTGNGYIRPIGFPANT